MIDELVLFPAIINKIIGNSFHGENLHLRHIKINGYSLTKYNKNLRFSKIEQCSFLPNNCLIA